jgi:TonB family protein
MSKRVWAGVLVGLLAVGAAAQDVKDGETRLRDAVMNKQLFLRGFSAEDTVRWRWDGGSLVLQAPKIRTLGVMTATSVKVKGNKVEIEGERHTLVHERDTKYGLFPGKERVSLEVDLKGADMATWLPQLPTMLFYSDMESALADAKIQPADLDSKCCTKKQAPDLKPCDCASPAEEVCAKTVGIKPPSVLSHVEPEFSDEARLAKVNGSVQVYLKVDAQGKPLDLWIMRSLGLGLDRRAGEAVSKYRFKPATCHGQAFPVDLYIDVNFQAY